MLFGVHEEDFEEESSVLRIPGEGLCVRLVQGGGQVFAAVLDFPQKTFVLGYQGKAGIPPIGFPIFPLRVINPGLGGPVKKGLQPYRIFIEKGVGLSEIPLAGETIENPL